MYSPFLIDDVVKTDEAGEYVVFCNGSEILVNPGQHKSISRSCLFQSKEFKLDSPYFLSIGVHSGIRVSLVDCRERSFPEGKEIYSLRDFIRFSSVEEIALAGRAAQLSHWQAHHKYCGACGTQTSIKPDERAFFCSECTLSFYPRIAPCVIGAIKKDDEILLARGRAHADIFSTIAGFMEAGETPEQAFAREVKEEVGLEVASIKYIESQFWPFPGQLMLGFVAEYKAGHIAIDENEILEAAWFKKNALPNLPPSFTISARLIQHVVTNME